MRQFNLFLAHWASLQVGALNLLLCTFDESGMWLQVLRLRIKALSFFTISTLFAAPIFARAAGYTI